MLEAKLTIMAPGLETALNNLAAAISGAGAIQANPTPAGAYPATAQTGAPAAPLAGPTAAYPSNQTYPAPQQATPVNPTPGAVPGAAQPAQYGAVAPGATMTGPTASPSNPPGPTNPTPASTASVAPMAGPTSAYPSNAPAAGLPVAQPPQYTVDQIMQAGATLMDAGRVNDLMNLLHSFGVNAVMDLKPEQLGAFATELRKMGAQI